MAYILLVRDDDVLMTGCDRRDAVTSPSQGLPQPEVMTGRYPIVTWEVRVLARLSMY